MLPRSAIEVASYLVVEWKNIHSREDLNMVFIDLFRHSNKI